MPILRRDGELDPTDGEAALLVAMSAVTINRRLVGERAKLVVCGRSHTKPGSLLKSQIPMAGSTMQHRFDVRCCSMLLEQERIDKQAQF